jgi:hypothetical protein
VIRTDGVIPSPNEMIDLFGRMWLEDIRIKVSLPSHAPYFGSMVVFRRIGEYNEVRNFMQRNNNIVNGIFRLMAK